MLREAPPLGVDVHDRHGTEAEIVTIEGDGRCVRLTLPDGQVVDIDARELRDRLDNLEAVA